MVTVRTPIRGTSVAALFDAREHPTLSVTQAARCLGIGRNQCYAAARAGELPVLRVGSRLFIKTADLNAMLGFDVDGCTRRVAVSAASDPAT